MTFYGQKSPYNWQNIIVSLGGVWEGGLPRSRFNPAFTFYTRTFKLEVGEGGGEESNCISNFTTYEACFGVEKCV